MNIRDKLAKVYHDLVKMDVFRLMLVLVSAVAMYMYDHAFVARVRHSQCKSNLIKIL